MKKLMHTLLSITFIVIFLIAVSTITVCAKDYLYGNIVETGITSGGIGAGTFQAKFCDSEGNQACYEFAETVVVNGETYYNNNYSTTNNIYDLVEALPYDVFARFSCVENKIYVLDFDATATTYNNITYNQTTGMFNIRGLDVRSLPVFYTYPTMYNDSFFKPYLDENHIYTIEVYDYAVKVVDYFALNYQNTLKNIYISQGVMQDYSLSLDISCVSTESSEKLSIEIYDDNSNPIYFKTSEQTHYINNKTILLTDISNADISGTIRIKLNDDSSPIYIVPFNIKKTPALYGTIVETGFVAGGLGPVYFAAKICDSDGNETVYNFAETVTINGETYYNNTYASENNAYDLQQLITNDTYVEFAVINNKIKTLNYGTPFYKFNLIKTFDEKVTARISVINASDNLVAYIATYNGENLVAVTPVKFLLTDTSKNKEINLKNVNVNDFDNAKLFVWDENLSPRCIPLQSNIID